ncbi:hypothetical protein FOB22_005866 [Saccharomyces cerevisiae]|nr:hypothetical protein FOB22_005866 [Saccharomyces cerevisiae]
MSSVESSPISRYEDEVFPLSNIITSTEDDCMFDMEFNGNAASAVAAASKESNSASGLPLQSNDAFANVAQQNYRLWLSSV